MNSESVIAILVAAGQGERFTGASYNKPKQFTDLCGVPLFIWSLATLAEHKNITAIVLVVAADWCGEVNKLIAKHLPAIQKKVIVTAGGKLRQESVWLALEEIAKSQILAKYVLIHDAARPFVTADDIDRIIQKLKEGMSATLAIPPIDTVKKVENNTVIEDLDRNTLALVQTPQGADFKLMLEAHRQARLNGCTTTDDTSIVKTFGSKVQIVPGSRLNFKITEIDDLLIARAIIESHNWQPGKITTFMQEKIAI